MKYFSRAERLAEAVDLPFLDEGSTYVPKLPLISCVWIGIGPLFSIFGLFWMIGIGMLSWFLLSDFWKDLQTPEKISSPEALIEAGSVPVLINLNFDIDDSVSIVSPKGQFTFYKIADSELPVYLLQTGERDKSTVEFEGEQLVEVVKYSRFFKEWSLDNYGLDLTKRFAAIGRDFPKEGIVLEPRQGKNLKRGLNFIHLLALICSGLFVLFLVWRIVMIVRLMIDSRYRLNRLNRQVDVAAVRAVASALEREPVTLEETRKLSKIDTLCLAMGWAGNLNILILAGIALGLILFASITLVVKNAAPSGFSTVEAPEIPNLEYGKRIEADLKIDPAKVVYVLGRRVSTRSCMLFPVKGKFDRPVFVFREDGFTRGEAKFFTGLKRYEVITHSSMFDWDLPIGSVDLRSGGTRYRIPKKQPKNTVVLVPLDENEPDDRSSTIIILVISIIVVVTFFVQLSLAFKHCKNEKSRWEFLTRLLKFRPPNFHPGVQTGQP